MCMYNVKLLPLVFANRQGPVTMWRYAGYVAAKIALVSCGYIHVHVCNGTVSDVCTLYE